MDKKNTVGYRRELLMVLEGKVWDILDSKPKTIRQRDTQDLISGLTRVIAGIANEDDYCDGYIWQQSRLIRMWFYLSMDLSL